MSYLLIFVCALLLGFVFLTHKKRPSAALVQNQAVSTCSAIQDCASVCLPKIQKLYPDFDAEQYARQAEETLVSIFQAISQQDSSLLVHSHPRLKKQIDNIIANQHRDGRLTPFDAVLLRQTALAGCRQEQSYFNITYQCALDCRNYTLKDNEIIKGSATEDQQYIYTIALDTDNWLFTYFERSK